MTAEDNRHYGCTFGVIPGKDNLHGGKKPGIELRLLVGTKLADTIADGDAAVLQLDHADGNAVDVEHKVGAALQPAFQRYFLDDGEVVLLRLLPVDELHVVHRLPGLNLNVHAVAKQ